MKKKQKHKIRVSPLPDPLPRYWRERVFWTLLLACAGLAFAIAVLENPASRKALELCLGHGAVRIATTAREADIYFEHLRWWTLGMLGAALLLRYAPLRPARGKSNANSPLSHASASSAAPAAPAAETASSTPGPHTPFALSALSPVGVGLFVIQLCLGAAFLTARSAWLSEEFWSPIPETPDRIRAEFVDRDILAARRLQTRIAPDDRVFLLTDPGVAGVFLNYYLYPRKIFSPTSYFPPNFYEESPAFWDRIRQRGDDWLLIYRPKGDPTGYGILLRYPKAARDQKGAAASNCPPSASARGRRNPR